jgi:hypothetical protein
LPDQWKESIIVPVHKKGDKTDCSNYRGISLLSTSYEYINLYSSSNIIRKIKSRRMRWAGHVAQMGEVRNAYRILMGKPEGNRPLGRPRRRWVDMYLFIVYLKLGL